ncbi:MAG: hypothetical protein QOH03_1559 [Kribbellaceae bacterium]|nr:hypothetical protein [Kribbellaceae bacterium]
MLQTQRPDTESARSTRYLAWAGTGLLGLIAAVGLVAGTTAVWSAFDPGTQGQSPAPLWLPPPATVHPKPAAVSTTPDDHGDRTTAPSSTVSTTEPGDKRGGKGKSSDGGSNHGKGHN